MLWIKIVEEEMPNWKGVMIVCRRIHHGTAAIDWTITNYNNNRELKFQRYFDASISKIVGPTIKMNWKKIIEDEMTNWKVSMLISHKTHGFSAIN